jgi:hypothetical protein
LGVGDLLPLIFKDSGRQGIKTAECLPNVREKLSEINQTEMKERVCIGPPKLNNYSNTKILVQNLMLRKEEPGRHLKKTAETFYATKMLKITVKFCRG